MTPRDKTQYLPSVKSLLSTHHPHKTFVSESLKRVVQQHFLTSNWECVVVDGFISADGQIHYTSSYQSDPGCGFHNFRFRKNLGLRIEAALTLLHETHPVPTWNKVRCIVHGDNAETDISTYFDPDYYWLESLDPEGATYAALSIEDELAILSWEGRHPYRQNRLFSKTTSDTAGSQHAKKPS